MSEHRAPELSLDLSITRNVPDAVYTLVHRVDLPGDLPGDVLDRAMVLAQTAGVSVGVTLTPTDTDTDAVRAVVAAQCAVVAACARRHAVLLTHVAVRGELAERSRTDVALARAIVDGVTDVRAGGVALAGPVGGALAATAVSRGIVYARDGVVDQKYRDDGTLVPWDALHGAHTEPSVAAVQAITLALTASFETLWVHGENPNVLAVLRAVRAALDAMAPRG